MFGWHPIPTTALGCSLHKRFHSFDGLPVKSENIGLAKDCLKATIFGREEMLLDAQKVRAVRAWFDSRSDLWLENIIKGIAPDQGEPLIVIRACDQPSGASDAYVYLNEDWIGSYPGKMHQRPICRGEWRQMAAIIKGS